MHIYEELAVWIDNHINVYVTLDYHTFIMLYQMLNMISMNNPEIYQS